MAGVLMRKYACNGMSTCTPFGTYTNEPPGPCRGVEGTELVVFRRHDGAEVFLTSSGYSRTAVSVSTKMTPCFFRSSWMEL